jgi:hypothetical protein
MKATMFQKCSLALVLAVASFFSGCDQQANSAPINDSVPSVTNSQSSANTQSPDLTAADTDQAQGNEPQDTNEVALENADGKLISTPDISSTNVSNNPQLADFVKLVQAGVGESVLMAYVTNSPGAFNLSSDDIVYLNDLGAPETTVTAMLQRDQYFNGHAASAPVLPTNAPSIAGGPAPLPGQVPIAGQNVVPVPNQNAMAQTAPLTPSADVEAEVEQSPNASYSYFYDSLSPYGNWIDIAGYGPCWQPTTVVSNPGWQPYCDRGRWDYTDCGWCWVSDYSWGWAPFHYGRWFHHNRWGWCWAPDTVWGPSWVSWRYSDSYCGWAPLPPSACYRPGFGFSYYGRSVGFNFGFGIGVNNFTFVSLNHFHDRYPGRYRVAHREVTKIYHTTIVNNQVIRGSNNRLISRGVPVDRVARATHTEIHPIHIRADANGPRTAQLGRDGRSLAVFRPALPSPKAGPAPRRVGEGVQAAPHFDLHSRVERANATRQNPTRTPVNSAAPERRPIISNPAMNRPSINQGRNDRNDRNDHDTRPSQPNGEKPGSLIMRGPNQQPRPDRGTSTRDGNAGQTPAPVLRHGPEAMPNQPNQPDRGQNNNRVLTPPLRPQDPGSSRNVPPTVNRPDISQPRDDGNQQRQQRQLLQQQSQQQQQRQQRDFQPVVPTPRGNNNQDSNPGIRSQPPVRSERVAPPRTFESRPAPQMRSAPPQISAPARDSRPDNGGGGGSRGGGGGGGGGQRGGGGNGNGRNR